jgi:hypothetical protein
MSGPKPRAGTIVPALGFLPSKLGDIMKGINEALNYVADTLLSIGAALVLASAVPRDLDRCRKSWIYSLIFGQAT